MAGRPSEPLLVILRDAIRARGISTVVLARQLGIDRSDLKKQLAGQDDLSIDTFLRLAEELGLAQQVARVTQQPASAQQPAGTRSSPEPLRLPERDEGSGEAPSPIRLDVPIRLDDRRPPADPEDTSDPPSYRGLDPEGNPARQLVEAGFLLGLDLHLVLERRWIGDSGVPAGVLSDRRFAELLPIRLESKFHRHNRPEFLEDAFRCTLSFDALYTCTFPWRAFRQVSFTLPPDAEPEPEKKAENEAKPARPALRLVKE